MATLPRPVILLPGTVTPARLTFAPLLDALGPDVEARPKELELYAAAAPPPGWSIATELTGIDRVAAEAGFERFHLVGYSGGGACCVAYAADRPERVLSLALVEPAFAGWAGMSPEERSHFEHFRAIAALPEAEQMPAFRDLQLAPGVVPPPAPPGPPPDWMTSRPAGVHAFVEALFAGDVDVDALRRYERPVWYALGARSHPDQFARMADRLAGVFPDFTIERFEERHHFDPPHRAEPARVAASLRALWARADPD